MASFVSPTTIALLAVEPSADALGASLALVLKRYFPDVQLIGMAGPQMRAAGVEPLWQMESVAVMGLWEVLKHYPRLKRLQRQIRRTLVDIRPSFVIGIDGPDFNLAIESYLKQYAIPVYHFVAPTVWAWRAGRAAKLAQQTDGLLCLFPFEPPYFLLHGLRAVAVGHPLADRLPLPADRSVHRQAQRQRLGLDENIPVLAVLPGSRASEWEYHLEIFFEIIQAMWYRNPQLHILIPCLHEQMMARVQPYIAGLPVTLVSAPNGASDVLIASDVALVVSGTATLETALCHTPMVIAYRMHAISWLIMSSMAKTPWAGLPNILANATIVPEFLQEDLQVDAVVMALGQLFDHPKARQAQQDWFERIHHNLRLDTAQTAVNTLLRWWQDDLQNDMERLGFHE